MLAKIRVVETENLQNRKRKYILDKYLVYIYIYDIIILLYVKVSASNCQAN